MRFSFYMHWIANESFSSCAMDRFFRKRLHLSLIHIYRLSSDEGFPDVLPVTVFSIAIRKWPSSAVAILQ